MNAPPKPVAPCFEPEGVLLPLNRILPVKVLPPHTKTSAKYRQIDASIREIGLIEPLVVARQPKTKSFLLLDGHVRLAVLRDMDVVEATCLVSTDDEAFTYNKRISRLATIQEHRMILRAIERGVPEERIARALNVDVPSIRRRRNLADGICAEVLELLEDKHCPLNTFRCLKKTKPIRQIEMAQLMLAANNFSVPYARALLAATPKRQLVDAEKPKAPKALSAEQIAQMEAEMANLQNEMKLIEDSYGPDHLNLTIARGYVASLLRNPRIVDYLERRHGDILGELRRIVVTEETAAEAAE